jgi:uncharacterized membrane protein YbhN (UPF0104 family)
MRGRTSSLFKALMLLAVSVLTIVSLIHYGLVQPEILSLSFQTGARWLCLAAALHVVAQVCALFRYIFILHSLSIPVNYKSVATASFVGTAAGQWLPGSMAFVEALRIGILLSSFDKNHPSQLSFSFESLGRLAIAGFCDRAMGMALFLMSGGSILVGFGFLWGVGALLLGLVLALLPLLLPNRSIQKLGLAIQRTSSQKSPGRIRQLILSVCQVLQTYQKVRILPRDFFGAILFSSLSNLLLVLSYGLYARSIGFEMPYFNIAAVLPFIGIASLIPMGFGGIGGYQVAAVGLFHLFALNPSSVATNSLLQGTMALLIQTALGFLFLGFSFDQVRRTLVLNKK